MHDYSHLRALLQDVRLPSFLVDLDAVDRNLERLLAPLPSALSCRPATKSMRIPGLMAYLRQKRPEQLAGWMTFSAAETAFLKEQGFDDFLLAYPFVRRDQGVCIAQVVEGGGTVRVVVDHPLQVEALSALAIERSVTFSLCMDIDLSWRPLGGLAHLGVRRSPIRSVEDALALGERIGALPGVSLGAVLALRVAEVDLAVPDRLPLLARVLGGRLEPDLVHRVGEEEHLHAARAERLQVGRLLEHLRL